MKYILIGGSNTLKETRPGKEIDTYDYVVRFNYSGSKMIVNNANKDIIGTKKNIWFCLETDYLVFKNLAWSSSYKKVFIKGVTHNNIYAWRRNSKSQLLRFINTIKKYNYIKSQTKKKSFCLYNLTKVVQHKHIYIMPANWDIISKQLIKKIEPKFSKKYAPTSGIKGIFYILLFEMKPFIPPPPELSLFPTPPPLPPYTPKAVLDKYIPKNYSADSLYLQGFDGFKTGHFYGKKLIKTQNQSDKRAFNGQNRHYGKGEQYILRKLAENKGLHIL